MCAMRIKFTSLSKRKRNCSRHLKLIMLKHKVINDFLKNAHFLHLYLKSKFLREKGVTKEKSNGNSYRHV